MIDKPFKTIDEQIDILMNQRHLLIRDIESAKNHLTRYGYYEIVNGYKENFLIDPTNDDRGYKEHADFEHMYSLFQFDRAIRNIVLANLEDFEATFKQTLAYAISLKISENQSRYLAPSHYNRGKTHHYRRNGREIATNDRKKLLNKMKKVTESNIEPFKHYRQEHGNVPPWIIVKGLSFGESIYLYSLSKPLIRKFVIARMLKMNIDETMVEELDHKYKLKQGFGDLLALYLDYRNLTAHGGRVYNHQSKRHALRTDSRLIYRDNVINLLPSNRHNLKYRSSIGVLIKSLILFSNTDPYLNMRNSIQNTLTNYLRSYPEDEKYLRSTMELELLE